MTDAPDTLGPEGAAAMLRELFAKSREGIGVADAKGNILRVNPALMHILGYDEESELVGRPVLDVIAPSARDLMVEVLRRRATGEAVPGTYKARALRRDGSETPIEVSTAPFSVGGEWHMLSFIRELPEEDTTHRRRRHDGTFYRALFEVNTAVKLLIDPITGEIVDANQAAVDMYGWRLDELLQMHITDINTLTPEEVRQELEAARTGRRSYFRFRHRTANGDIRHVEIHSGPVEIDGRQLLLSIVHDVTERDALEEQLRVSQRLETVGRLAGGIAHDFNNLITIMMSSSELLLRRTEPDSPLRPHIDDLIHTARRAADLTRDLLTFSRRQVVEPRVLSLGGLMTRISGLLRRTLGTEYTVESVVEEDLPPVMADPGQLEQVVMNLAINARDAMPGGGRLRITVRAADAADDDARGVPTGRWLAIEVADEGAGMDEHTRQRVFEPFFTTKVAGTGLGLATVHGIVSQSGGHVTVSSEIGQGSVFTVYLPAAEDSRAAHPTPPVRTSAENGHGRVLLVDDMDDVRHALARGLAHAGFEVVEAASADEALALPQDQLEGLDAVVSDVVMPGRSGVELARELASRVPRVPILLVSGELRDNDPATFPRAVRFLPKPFTVERLAGAIRSAMAGQSSAARSEDVPPG